MNSVVVAYMPYLTPMLMVAAAVVAWYALTRWRQRHIRPVSRTSALMLWCGSLLILTNAFEIMSPDLRTALFWNRVTQFGIAPIPLLWLVMSLQFAGRQHLLTPQRMMWLVSAYVVCLAVLLTNSYHGLFITDAYLDREGSVALLVAEPGPFMIIFYVYGYLIVMVGAHQLTQNLLISQGFRWQGTMILIGVIITVSANILDWSQVNPLAPLKLTPLGLVVSIPLFILTLVRTRRADLVPVARSNVIQIMQDGVLMLDLENRILDMNPAAEDIIGHRLVSVLGKPLDTVWPAWADHMTTRLAEPAGRNEIQLNRDAQHRVFDLRRSDLTDSRGQNISRIVVFRDITERARAEETLRQKEAHFRALTENASDIVVVIKPDGAIDYASPSIERVFGFSVPEIIGVSAFDFIHPDDIEDVLTALADAAQQPGIAPLVIARFRQASGSWLKLECIANNLLDLPAVHGIVVNARDVTDRVDTEERLRHSEEQYRLHFSHINDVIYSFNSELKITSVSPSIERVLGYKPEDFLGKSLQNMDALSLLSTEYQAKAAIEALRVLSGERIESTIYEFRAIDGTPRLGEVSASPVFRDGKVVSAINIARDITERVRAEERLKASLVEKEILLKEIHHRVKNNLQIIASLLNLQSSSIDNPLMLARFQESQDRIRSMALIHERLYRSNDLAYIDFGTYLQDLTIQLMQGYRSKMGGVELKTEAENVSLDIDTALACGLIVNELVSNALKHAFPDGRTGEAGVTMQVNGDGQCLLEVWDNGVGMPQEVNFYKTTSLGLQLVNSLVRQLRGTVRIHTSSGTRFSIRFPITISNPSVQLEHHQ